MSNKFKGTPGPWAQLSEEVDKSYIRIRGTKLGCRYKIANVLTPDYVGVLPLESKETRANAKLIAAAPELLDALQWIINNSDPFRSALEMHHDVDGEALYEMAVKAINKALGE